MFFCLLKFFCQESLKSVLEQRVQRRSLSLNLNTLGEVPRARWRGLKTKLDRILVRLTIRYLGSGSPCGIEEKSAFFLFVINFDGLS